MTDFFLDCLKWLTLFAVIYAICKMFLNHRRTYSVVRSTWYHLFPDQSLSALDFYTSVTEKIQAKEIKGISLHIVEHGEDWWLSGKRKYLQITRSEDMLLVCAAPFGPDFFVSWRVGVPFSAAKEFFIQLPLIGKALERSYNHRTFFEIDTSQMFCDMVHNCVLVSIQELTSSSGVRLSDLDRKPTNMLIQATDI